MQSYTSLTCTKFWHHLHSHYIWQQGSVCCWCWTWWQQCTDDDYIWELEKALKSEAQTCFIEIRDLVYKQRRSQSRGRSHTRWFHFWQIVRLQDAALYSAKPCHISLRGFRPPEFEVRSDCSPFYQLALEIFQKYLVSWPPLVPNQTWCLSTPFLVWSVAGNNCTR